jgi:hypothetical protein
MVVAKKEAVQWWSNTLGFGLRPSSLRNAARTTRFELGGHVQSCGGASVNKNESCGKENQVSGAPLMLGRL